MKTKILAILKKELRETFRDKKSLVMMLIIPCMIPLLVIGMSALFESEVNKDSSDYNKIGFTEKLTEDEKKIVDALDIDIVIESKDTLEDYFNKRKIYAYISKEDGKYIIYYENGDINSNYAANLAESYLINYKQYLQANYLANCNINPNEFNDILTYEYSQVEEQNFYANYVVNYAFLFIIMAITISATYPATDATAGEKERGTLETLLTFPIKSKDIIIGKLLSVTISSIITGFLSLVLTILSLLYVQNKFTIFADTSLINPQLILVNIIIILSYSLLISGLCLSIASMSKTFKEAQSALTPITFISFFPGMITFMLNINNSLLLSFIPFINYTLIIEDASNYNLNYLHVLVMFLSTILLTTIVISYIIKQYKSEKVLFTN